MSKEPFPGRKKKQHYLPRFYLRGFADARERLWTLDKVRVKTWPTTVQDAAHQNQFYEVPEDIALEADLHPQFLEDWFAAREGRQARSLEQMLLHAAAGTLPSIENRVVIADFVFDLNVRTPQFREYRKQSTEGLLSALIEELIEKNRDNFAEIGLATARPPRAVYNPDVGPIDQAEFVLDDEMRREVVGFLLGMIWIVGESHPGVPLYTSDSPVARTAHAPEGAEGGMGGMCSPGIELTIPLNHQFSLHLFERSHHASLARLHGRVHPLAVDLSRLFNALQARQSSRFVFSRADDWAVARTAMSRFPDCRDPNRPQVRTFRGTGEDGDIIGQIPI